MKKSGLLRRIVILVVFGVGFDQFVLSDSQFIVEASSRDVLKLFLWGSIAFGIVTLLAQRAGAASPPDEEDES